MVKNKLLTLEVFRMDKEIQNQIKSVKDKHIPTGYVYTEAGLLPVEWKFSTLEDITEKITKTAGTDLYETLSISASIGFVNQAKKFGKELSGKQYEKYIVLNKGDFSYNKGNSKTYPQGCIYRLQNREVAAVPNVFESFRTKFGCAEYYDQLFISGYLNKQLSKKINHGVRDDGLLNLTGKDFYSCFLPVPPIEEQEKIAEILTACDKVIELKEKLIEEKKKQKKYLMKQLLTAKLGLNSSSKPWKKILLKELAEIDTGNSDTQDKVDNGNYPFFVRSEKIERINRYSYDGEAILIPGDGKIGEIFHYYIGKFDYHQRVYKISNFTNCKGKYIYYYLQQFFKKRAVNLTVKATVDSLRMDMLTDMPILLPEEKEQEYISGVLSIVDKIIITLEKELKEWKKKKKALTQLLLTGIVRVNKE